MILWAGMVVTVLLILATAATHFDPHRAFTLPAGALTPTPSFFAGLGAGLLIAVSVLVQFIAQIGALTVLRLTRPELPRPFRQWAYPLPSLAALAGWLYIYQAAGATAIRLSLLWLGAGMLVYGLRGRRGRVVLRRILWRVSPRAVP